MPAKNAQLLINDLSRHNGPLLAEIEGRIRTVLQSGWYILGKEVRDFEEAFAAFCGVSECVGVGNGTDALELALRALDIGPGDEVVTVANAGGYSTTAIRCTGAQPVYIDVTPDSMLLDPDALRDRITTRTKAVIATHLYGRMVDMPSVLAIAKRHRIPVIEDCAQAHGATLGSKRAGAWGELGCFSFYPTKNLGAFGDAGAVTMNDSSLAKRARSLRQYGWTRKYDCGGVLGRNSRLDEIQAAILSFKLPYLEGWNCARRRIADKYFQLLQGTGLQLPGPAETCNVVHLYVIRSLRRDQLRAALAEQGIGTEVHYPIPDHRQPGQSGPVSPHLPVTEACCREVLTLPCFPEMRDDEVLWVSDQLRQAARQVCLQ